MFELSDDEKGEDDEIVLPHKILPLPNKDKGFHEKWEKDPAKLDLGNFPHPFRAAVAGPPNAGKTTIVKHLVLHQNPPFDEIVVVHCDMGTKEYEDLDCEVLDAIPDADKINPKRKKMLVILDDIDFKSLNKQQKHALSRLYGYASTHRGVSVIACTQNPIDFAPTVRRCSNLFCFGRYNDMEMLSTVGRKIGLSRDDWKALYKYVKDPHDFLFIDLSDGTPAYIRKNCYDILVKKQIL